MQVGATQHDGSDKHPMSPPGHPSTDENAAEADEVDQIDDAGEEQLSDDDQMLDEEQEDDDQVDDASDVSMEPPEQSGYPAESDDEQRETDGDSPSAQVDLTAETPVGRKSRIPSESKATGSEVIELSDSSSDDGNENVGIHSVVPKGSINMQHAHDSTFLAAVKRQSKVKEGDWTQVRRQSNSGDYGLIDID